MVWWVWAPLLSGPILAVVWVVLLCAAARAEGAASTPRHRADPAPAEELPRSTYIYRL